MLLRNGFQQTISQSIPPVNHKMRRGCSAPPCHHKYMLCADFIWLVPRLRILQYRCVHLRHPGEAGAEPLAVVLASRVGSVGKPMPVRQALVDCDENHRLVLLPEAELYGTEFKPEVRDKFTCRQASFEGILPFSQPEKSG